ncbi:uncharacterized protein, partial [Drosophila pseudoobscura]|uniref:Endonuclease/exonuclease/phosphatase domain-containing protein n=1 Tax=Drosophila pseudoobscura pseudoobscura TaxID=46245 RepID=A0A6I8VP46_DROPS
DHTAVSLEGQERSLRICSAYMGHEQPDPPPHAPLRALIADCSAKDIGLIVGCDANAHHCQWGSTDTNERGEYLFSYLLTTQMVLLNRGSDPTLIIKNRKEVLDLTLASHEIQRNIVSWRVLEEHSFSDHRYVETVFSFSVSKPVQFRNIRRTNWTRYSDYLCRVLPEPPSEEEFSTEATTRLLKIFTDACNKALDKACPSGKNRGRKKPEWWNPKLGELRKASRRLFNKAAENVEQNWAEYKASLSTYNKELRIAKRASWRKFCSEIESNSEASRLRRVLSKTTPTLGYLKNTDQSWTTSSEESLNLLLNTHFPGCDENRPNYLAPPSVASNAILRLLSQENISWAIRSFKPYKSAGPDGIFPAQLIHAGHKAINWLKIIYEGIFSHGCIPDTWLQTKVVFIPKAGKPSHTAPNDFRPISLSSFLLKAMERLL